MILELELCSKKHHGPKIVINERKFFYIPQKNSVFPSVREFKKILPNTFIYESILLKIYMNANIMNTQIFYLNGH